MAIPRSIVFCFMAAFGGWVFGKSLKAEVGLIADAQGYDIGYISGCLVGRNQWQD
jgi:hypothetical protein